MEKDTKEASSDDESEAQFSSVSNYHLEDEDREYVSFDVLPIQWGEAKKDYGAAKEQVFLQGFTDNGLKMIMMQVVAWRFNLTPSKPEISVLISKHKRWVTLQKPRISYQDSIRTILITVHFLHRVKRNPEISAKSVWDSLFKDRELSFYKSKPSQKDLLDHMPLIGDAAKRFVVLSKSKLLQTLLKEKSGNKKLSDEKVKDSTQSTLIVDDVDNGVFDGAKKESKAEVDSSSSVCAICDDGGTLLGCEGPCLRSFHPTKKDGIDSMCDSLGFTQKEADGIKNFYCKNCKYNQHQCFACGKLGSSGKVKGAEVIKCASASCSHFYHPHCVAKLLPKVVKHAAKEHETNVADAKSFTCPVHYCCVCKEVENTIEPELQFAICRRCPKSYHRKCLPREIAFADTDEDILPRAWEGLLPENRILMYCLNHEIDEEVGTPARNHIKFPNVKSTVPEISDTEEVLKSATKQRAISNKNNVKSDNSSGKSSAKGSKVAGKVSPGKVCPNLKATVSKISDTKEKMKPAVKHKNIADLDDSPGRNSAKGSKVAGKPSLGNLSLDVKATVPKISDTKGKNPDVKATVPKISDTKGKMKPYTKHSVTSNKNNVDLDSSSGKSSAKGSKVTGKVTPGKVGSGKKSEKIVSGSNISTKPKADGTSRSCLTENRTLDTDVNQPLRALIPNFSKQTKSTKSPVCETPSVKPIRQQDDKKTDQQNIKRPLLSNCSHSDSTTKHKALDQEGQGHVSSQRQVSNNIEKLPADRTMKSADDQEDLASMNGGQKSSSRGNVNREIKEVQDSKMSKSGRTSLKRKRSEENDTREQGEVSSTKRQASVEHHSGEGRADHSVNGSRVDKILPSPDLSKSTDDQAPINRGQKSSSRGNVDRESREAQASKMNKSGRTTSLKRKCTDENDTRGQGEVSSAKRQAVSEMLEGVSGHSQPKAIDDGNPATTCAHGEIRTGPSVEEEHRSEEEEKELTDSDIRQRYMRYGYARPCSVSGSSYKMKDDSMGSLGSGNPAVCRNGASGSRVPQCGYVDSLMGFAAGPHPFAYSPHNSAGWITD